MLSEIHPISGDFKDALEKELTPLTLPKNYMLLEAPRIADFAYFLDSGFAMSFVFADGRRVVEEFWQPGQIILSSSSFFEQVRSKESIQLITRSDVLSISYTGVQRMFREYPEAQILYRIIMNRHYENCRARTHDLQRLTARQRFEKLLAAYPDIEQLVPQDYIASYLGITPQSLSRLKKKYGRP